jgi:hypothetical protein
MTRRRRMRLAKLLCPVCLTLQQVEWRSERGELVLACGHKRKSALPAAARIIAPANQHTITEEIEYARQHD